MKRRRGRRKGSRGRKTARQDLRSHRLSEPGSRGAPELYEKLWVPWNGLVVIGKRIELLGRNTQKRRLGDPKLEADYWRLEDVARTALREKPGLNQERQEVKPVRSLSSALQATAGLGRDGSKEKWERPEVRHRTGAESEGSGTLAGPRRGSKTKEKLRFSEEIVQLSGEHLRSRVFTIKQTEEMLRSNGRKLSFNGDNPSGESLRLSGEKLNLVEDRLRLSGDKLRLSGDKLSSSEDKLSSSEDKLRLSREKLKLSEDQLRLSGEKLSSSEDKLRLSGEKLSKSEDKLRLSGEKLSKSEDKLRLSGEKLVSSGEKPPASREILTDGVERPELGVERGGSQDATAGERLESTRQRQLSVGERRLSGGERRLSGGERRLSGGERQASKGFRRERRGSLAEKMLFKGDRRGSKVEKLGLRGEKRGSREEKRGTSEERRHSRIGSIDEEQVERVVKFTGDENFVDTNDTEMEILSERIEEKDELEGMADTVKVKEGSEVKEEVGAEEGAEVMEEGVGNEGAEVEGILPGGKDVMDDSVSMEEREVINEEPGD